MAEDLHEADSGELSLYFDTAEGELADLEVAAQAAIEWSRGLKAAAMAVDPRCDYRVTLVAARPGSSNWIARIERSAPNRAVARVGRGWKKIPVIMRLGIGLAVAIPLTIDPTIEYWLGDDGFTEKQKSELREIYEHAAHDDQVKTHNRLIYKTAQKDRKIIGIGTGIPRGDNWRPKTTVPSNRFAEADGLFALQEEASKERTIPQTLDVVLVTPRLENAARAWTFRQEGLPGTFNAVMKDKDFLSAMDRSAVRETFRLNIPMRIRLEVKQRLVDGEWRVTRQGRSVVEVLEPKVG